MINEFLLVFITGLIMVIVLGLAIYLVMTRLYRELKRKETEAIEMIIEAQERERSAISREVHDNLGPILSIAQMRIGYMAEQAGDEKLSDLLTDVQLQMQQAIHLCRDISHMISPEMNQDRDLRTVLEEQIALINQVGRVAVKLEMDAGDLAIDAARGTYVVRIIQELMTNTIKHSSADKVEISITKRQDFLRVLFSDNGEGFPVSEGTQGMGIRNINKRIAILGGTISWNSLPVNKGVKITMTIPLKNMLAV